MHLFGSYTSPYVRHCRIALRQEGFPFEFTPSDRARSAAESPTMRVPYLRDGDLLITDSTAILWHIRNKAGKRMFAETRDVERYTLANTALDTCINLFLLELDGVTETPYLSRQRARTEKTFGALDASVSGWRGAWDDSFLRLGCLLAWVGFRKRYDITPHHGLTRFLKTCEAWSLFAETAPPPN